MFSISVNSDIKLFIVHMHPIKKGNVIKVYKIKQIIYKSFVLSIFIIKYISCGGDNYHDSFLFYTLIN